MKGINMTWDEILSNIDKEHLETVKAWLGHLRDQNKVRVEKAAVPALLDAGGKQHQTALLLLGAQQQLEALIIELTKAIGE